MNIDTAAAPLASDSDPLVIATKQNLDVEDHEHYVEVEASVYLSHGESAIHLDFGSFDASRKEVRNGVVRSMMALDTLIDRLVDTRQFLGESLSSISLIESLEGSDA